MNKILKQRKSSIIKIQSFFRGQKLRENIKSILNKFKDFYIFAYNYNMEFFDASKKFLKYFSGETGSGKIKLGLLIYEWMDSYEIKRLNFEYSEFFKCYFLFLNKKEILRTKYKVNFVVNERILFDKRYYNDNYCEKKEDIKNHFYNIITVDMFINRDNKKVNDDKIDN